MWKNPVELISGRMTYKRPEITCFPGENSDRKCVTFS